MLVFSNSFIYNMIVLMLLICVLEIYIRKRRFLCLVLM